MTVYQNQDAPAFLKGIEEKLLAGLAATSVEITDNSWMHAGHAENSGLGGTHLALRVVSSRFEGMPLLDRHRTIHQLLKEEMAVRIHALELKLQTPGEAARG